MGKTLNQWIDGLPDGSPLKSLAGLAAATGMNAATISRLRHHGRASGPRDGLRRPSHDAICKFAELSGGAVTPNDWYPDLAPLIARYAKAEARAAARALAKRRKTKLAKGG